MTTFEANYDASGSEDDKGPLIFVGLVASQKKWLRFEDEWLAVLCEYKVPYFHLKELNDRHRESKPGKPTNVYAKWHNDSDTPNRFVSSLITVLKRNINKTFSTAIILDDYKAVNNLYKLRESVGKPYWLCASSCVSHVEAWMAKKPHDRVLHIVESGDCGQKGFIKLLDKTKVRVVPKDKKDKRTGEWFAPFQGADLVAGYYRRAAKMRNSVARYEDYGHAFNRIAFGLPQKAMIYSSIALRQMVLDYEIARR